MNSKPKLAELSSEDLTDRIAKSLPDDIRADYWRELMHCRSLPENDEMLRILRILQILTFLMEQVPNRVVIEREKLEQLFAEALKILRVTHSDSVKYQKDLDERLIALPGKIVNGIKPEVIASSVNESLRQQFQRSTIPDTARALGAVADRMKQVTAEFGSTASTLGDSYRGAAEEARRAVQDMNSTVSLAAKTARQAAEQLYVNFKRAYWWSLCGLTGVALLLGFLFGILCMR